MVRLLTDKEYASCYFNNIFSAQLSLFSVLGGTFVISANQSVSTGQALKMSGAAYRFADVDWNGLLTAEGAAGEQLVATDYAGMMPAEEAAFQFWGNGAGFLETGLSASTILIDLMVLNPHAKSSGAVVLSKDEKLVAELQRFASLGMQKGPVWNDKVAGGGIDGLMSPLAREYWESHLEAFIAATKATAQTAAFYSERLAGVKLVEPLNTCYPRFYPFRLAPELLCPKEDIYTELLDAGIAVSVPYKPLYRYDAFKADQLRETEQFYKSVMALPVHGLNADRALQIMGQFEKVLEKYAYRGCSF